METNSKIEIRLQWVGLACMAIGLVISIYSHSHTLKASRIESEINSYLHLNDRYHSLLFTLIQNDSEVFQKSAHETLQKNKYIMYELFELLATINMLEKYFKELDRDVWPCWEKRLTFLFSKPSVRAAWHSHLQYAEKIYAPDFVCQVNHILSSSNS